MITFTADPATLVQIGLTIVLPILVGLVTTRITSSAVKAWLLAGLTLATSLLTELGRSLAAGTTYDIGVALLAALPAFGISVALHYGLWKPVGLAGAAQDAGRIAPQPDDIPGEVDDLADAELADRQAAAENEFLDRNGA